MKFNTAKVIGLNSDQQAAQGAVSEQDGNLFLGILKLSCDDAFTRGRQLLAELADFYLEIEGTPAEKLTKTFAEAEKKLTDVASVSLGLATVSGKTLYLIAKGSLTVLLKRDNKLSPVLPSQASAQLISGFLQEGDRILFATDSFIKFLREDLENSLNLKLIDFEEEFNQRLATSDFEDQGLSALLLEIDKETPETNVEEVDEKISPLPNYDAPSFPTVSTPKLNLPNLKRLIPQSGRGRLAVAILIILVILFGVGLQYKNSRDQLLNSEFTVFLQAAQRDFDTSLELQTLNPAEAKNKLTSAKDNLSKALNLKPQDSAALALQSKINQSSDQILQQFKASVFSEYLNLNLIKKDFRPHSISLSVGKILLLDPVTSTLVTVDLVKKSQQIQAGESSLGQAQFASLNGNSAFVFSKDKGVVKVDTTNQKATTVAKVDEGWGTVVEIAGFSGNVYLLDSTKNQIWKYVPAAAGYSSKQEYLNKDVKADFSTAKKMQIESSVYILKGSSELIRFTRGSSDFFSVGGLDKPLSTVKSIFASSEAENFYILDSGNSRLVVTNKTGSYKSQYQGDKFASATDLVVDEKGKKVYLLDSGKIYSMDLK